MLRLIATTFCIAASMTLAASPAYATVVTDSFDSNRIGRTSKGGVNQSRPEFSTGTIASYGDVWRASHIFDISSLIGTGTSVSGARLDIVVDLFVSNQQSEIFSAGGYTGALDTLKTDNFIRPTYSVNTSIYPALAAESFAEVVLDSSTTSGSVIGLVFNSSGIDYLQQAINSNSAEVALGTKFGIDHYTGANRFLTPGSSQLVIQHSAASGQVASPGPMVLIVSGLMLLSWRRSRVRSPSLEIGC